MSSWQDFESNVKTLASFIWNCNAINETINGVKFDCVLKQKPNYWIVVEITENETLIKVRTDIAKFATCRHYLFSKNIFAEFYLVLPNEPTESMQTTGSGDYINVISYATLSKKFIDYESYVFTRQQKVFGSAVNPLSGDPDNNDYTPVYYQNVRTKKDVSIKDISKSIFNGKRVIMLGNYGTGKSRFIRELFYKLSFKSKGKILYPIAINLKENWGTQRADEIIRRHFGLLGLSNLADPVLKVLDSDRFIFLLDGFDEIGSQVWSNDTYRLKQIRISSLAAINDLLKITKSPVVITGREHYFNSEKEMFDVLGLNASDTELFKCKDEFTNEEMTNYLKSISLAIELPIWLPKRPLICQIINTIQKEDLNKIFIDSFSSVEFWNTLIKNICEREARISPKLQSDTIFKILKVIANISRIKPDNNGPITFYEINKAFEKVVGTAPVDDAAVMLQRLPGLGRVSSENTDRQFIDSYLLDGLRADYLIDIVYKSCSDSIEDSWLNSLGKTGIEIIAKRIQLDKSANIFIEYLKKSNIGKNKVLVGDILASLTFYAKKNILDLGGLKFDKIKISSLNFSKSLIENFFINDSEIMELDISSTSFSKIQIKDSYIRVLYGISSEEELPKFISGTIIEYYHIEPMEFNNKLYGLSTQHLLLIKIIRKIFFLGKSHKSEEEIVNGFGSKENRAIAVAILKLLIKEKIISKPDSNNGYQPKSFQRDRMKKILIDLNKSKDPLWKEVEQMIK